MDAAHIKDVNTRYHDAAADEYDAKWGIDFGATGQEQVRLKLVKVLGGLGGRGVGEGPEHGPRPRHLFLQPGPHRAGDPRTLRRSSAAVLRLRGGPRACPRP